MRRILLGVLLLAVGCGDKPLPLPDLSKRTDLVAAPVAAAPADGYLFCSWNCENLFDDVDNGRAGADRQYDHWLANNPADREAKYGRLADALVAMNGGRGPDIFVGIEIESRRAAELLRDAMNAKLPPGVPPYDQLAIKELTAGRHIVPAVIARVPLGERVKLHGSRLRILEAHAVVNGRDLTILATHWTSRLTDHDGGSRDKYADQAYRVARQAMAADPNVALLICGDFNDGPDEPAVRDTLHATADAAAVLRRADPPLLLNLFAGRDPKQHGTLYYSGKWDIFDQIVVTPGLLDGPGWRCDPASAAAVRSLTRPGDRTGKPWRFGNENDKTGGRGYSDHFPVTVRLRAG